MVREVRNGYTTIRTSSGEEFKAKCQITITTKTQEELQLEKIKGRLYNLDEETRKGLMVSLRDIGNFNPRSIYSKIDTKKMEGIARNVGTLLFMIALNGTVSHATGTIADKFNPIIDILKQLARPVAYGSFIYAGIVYCLGQKTKAWFQIKSTIVGYIFIQWCPWLMDVIDTIGRSS